MQQVPTWLQKQDNPATLQGIQSQSDPDGNLKYPQLQIHQQLHHQGEGVVEGKEELGQYEDADS